MRKLLCALLFSISSLAQAQGEVLTIAFNNKPPFFYFEYGEPKGILVEQAKQVLQRAGVAYQFEELPFQRIMSYLEARRPMFAALGFSKTKERDKFVVYSRPIYRDRTPVVLVRVGDVEKFRSYPSFERMVQSGQLVFGGKDGNAYPVDAFLKNLGPLDRRFSTEAFKLPQLLMAGRFDFTVLYPEELPVALQASNVDAAAVQQLSYPDIPQGGVRYILFSEAVPRNSIERINKAIESVLPVP